jgi:uncharacterized membrane protein
MNLSKTIIISFLIVAFIGFVDASFLAANHFSGVTPPCFITQGCDVVTTSAYAKIVGIPVSALGVLYYLSQLILMIYFVDKKDERVLPLIALSSAVGFGFSLWFTYVQVFLLKSYCTYCLFSGLTSTILFALGVVIWKQIQAKKKPAQAEINQTI